ncbi:aromatic ring-hydroxylating dioxygenase subunit alpha [bacterium]|nr:aromatic ring-hydroxylating dioxygenase subunit alpha [bacterium]
MTTKVSSSTTVHGAPPKPGQPVTAERYTSEKWLARENAELWPKVWQFACLERDVAEPGQYVVLNIGRESIIVSRANDGGLAANFNVCQHRGARVLTNDRGCEQRFTCPYHGWSYRPDGRLIVVPDNPRFPGGGVDRTKHSLKKLRVASALGMVWVCASPDTEPLEDFLGPLIDRIAPYDLASMTLVGDQTVTLACNWKAVFDNFQELYHVEHIHPQHQELFDCPSASVDLFEHGHTGVTIEGHTLNARLPIADDPNFYQDRQLRMFGADPEDYRGRVLDIRADIPNLRRAAGPRLGWDYDAFTDERLTDIEQYNAFPNTMITVQPDDALIVRARPHPTDPNWCYWDKFTLLRQPDEAVALRHGVPFEPHNPANVAPIARPEHDEFDQDDIIEGRKTMGITIDQDVHYIRDVQAGMHSSGFDAALLCEEEARIQHYHDWLSNWMGED